eukprot:TRINITY_DN217_c0_g1_i4.p1 TRINITY_DN217_c0_g1~~TRINITY_DN217_c0_g1_i4.p1  ORF type:complete len:510 (+),score=243.35 TRINITY_DN217_c0_g1_i4:176-1705(+)
MIGEVLEKIPTNLLVDIFVAKGLKSEKRRPPREEVLPKVEELIQSDSLKQFVYLMQKKELKEWAKKIKKHVLAARNNNTNSSAVMRKRLFEQLQEQGLEAYMEKLSPSERLLSRTLMDMGVAAKKSDGREALSKLLLSEIEMAGIEGFMKNSFSVAQLKEIAEEQKITAQTASPNILVECIITGKDYTPEKKIVKKKKKPAKDEPAKEEPVDPLLEGTTFEERAPWKLLNNITFSFSEGESDEEWVDREKLKDVPFKDEVPEDKEEAVKTSARDRAPRSRKVNEGVSYLLVESEEEKDSEEESSDGEYGKPKKKKKKDDKEKKDKKDRKKEKKDKKRKREKKDEEEDEDRKERKHKKHKSKKEKKDKEEEDEEKESEKSAVDETEKSEKKGKKKGNDSEDEDEAEVDEEAEKIAKKKKKEEEKAKKIAEEEAEKKKAKKKEEERAKKIAEEEAEKKKAKKKEEERAKKMAEEEAEKKKDKGKMEKEVSDKENDEDRKKKDKKKDKKKQY